MNERVQYRIELQNLERLGLSEWVKAYEAGKLFEYHLGFENPTVGNLYHYLKAAATDRIAPEDQTFIQRLSSRWGSEHRDYNSLTPEQIREIITGAKENDHIAIDQSILPGDRAAIEEALIRFFSVFPGMIDVMPPITEFRSGNQLEDDDCRQVNPDRTACTDRIHFIQIIVAADGGSNINLDLAHEFGHVVFDRPLDNLALLNRIDKIALAHFYQQMTLTYITYLVDYRDNPDNRIAINHSFFNKNESFQPTIEALQKYKSYTTRGNNSALPLETEAYNKLVKTALKQIKNSRGRLAPVSAYEVATSFMDYLHHLLLSPDFTHLLDLNLPDRGTFPSLQRHYIRALYTMFGNSTTDPALLFLKARSITLPINK